jgi:EAL domain-containing protein (putative c-di-GMP-specific phosphodiesterase class I)
LKQRFEHRLAAGEFLFREGEHGDCAYIVESGAVEIRHDAPEGSRLVARLGPQDLFGEMALFGEHRRSAAALAAEDCVLTVITHGYLEQRLQNSDPMLRHMLRTLVQRCRQLLGGAAAADQPDEADRSLAHARLYAEQDLMLALEQGQLLPYFQPIVRLADQRIAGFEALVRWHHPQRGLVPPGDFIALAEESSLINRIGLWIIDRSCAALEQFNSLWRGPPLFMSINLSARQLSDPAVLPALEQALARYEVAPAQLKMEVTESLLLQRIEEALPLLEACRARGMRVSLDDFGTGYSSLSYLHRLPLDTIKLDRSFVLQIDTGEAASRIVAALIRLAHELGLDVITEGLETAEQIATLKNLGSDMGQGYWFGRPAGLEATAEILRKSA